MLTIPTFFEILNTTFPNLKYDENTSKIQGLKLVLNVKQQIQLKNQKQLAKPVPTTLTNGVPKVNPLTVNITSAATSDIATTTTANVANTTPLSPLPAVSINLQAPVIPLLTPPTPPVHTTANNIAAAHQQTTSPSKSAPTTILQKNDLNVLNANTESVSENSGSSNVADKPPLLLAKKDMSVKENGSDFAKSDEKILENIEARISLIKEAQSQKTHVNGNHTNLEKSNHKNNENHVPNGHAIDDKEDTSLDEKENNSTPLVNGLKENGLREEAKEVSDKSSSSALTAAIADENSSSSTTSTLTSTSSITSDVVTSQDEVKNTKKRKLSSSNLDANESQSETVSGSQTDASPKKKNLKMDDTEDERMKSVINETAESQIDASSTSQPLQSAPSTSVETLAFAPQPSLTTSNSETTNESKPQTSQNVQQSIVANEPQSPAANSNPSLSNNTNSSNSGSSSNNTNLASEQANNGGDYLCEWNNCKRLILFIKTVSLRFLF